MSRFVSLAWNEDPAVVGLYLAEGLGLIRKSRAALPVLVDARRGAAKAGDPVPTKANVELLVSDARDPAWPRGTKTLAGTGVPLIKAEHVSSQFASWYARCDEATRAGTLFLVLPDTDFQSEAAAAAGTALYMATPSSGTPSALYAFVKDALRISRKPLTVAVAISGCGRLEAAAESFVMLSGEVRALFPEDQKPDLVFAGALAFDLERMALSRSVGRAYGDLYSDDSTAGRFAYVARKVVSMLSDPLGEAADDPLSEVAALAKERVAGL